MHTSRRAARGLAIAVAVLAGASGLALAGPGVALASTSTVTNCDGSGPGSLLDAVTNAAADDTIAFDPTLSCDQITLADPLFINKDLTITGPGAAAMTVSVGAVAPVVDIIANVQVVISGLTIENGNHPNDVGGGIDNGGTLTLTDSTVSGSSASAGGGGIYNGGTMNVTDSTVSGNNTVFFGGGIYNLGTMNITGSTVSGNISANFGGGIFNGGTMNVADSTVSGNSSTTGDGGGIENDASNANLTVTDSTISGNSGSNGAGGIYNGLGIVTVVDSTVSGNTGFGIWADGSFVNLAGTIVAGNTSGDRRNCFGATRTFGYNLTDGTCGFPLSTDVVAFDPGLGPLADNGGPTQTMLPEPGSPAAGVIPPGTTVSIDNNDLPLCPRTDQRGVDSTPGANCTIGAVEVPAPITITVTVSGTQVYGGSPVFTQTSDAPDGVTLDASNLSCTTAGGSPLSSLAVGSYTLDGSSCTGVSASGPGSYRIDYTGAADGFTVTKATPQITWNNPAAITWGTPLSATQLDATASVPGTFTYTPPAGTVLGLGNNQPLSVSFQPTDATDYNDATATVTIDVVPPTSCITGKYLGPLVIGNGQTVCVQAGAVITSGVIIQPGGALYMTGGTIKGSVSASGAAAITMCGGSLSGSVTITGSTGPLAIGTCGKNTIAGSVSITGNTGGLTYQSNVVSGSLTVTGNSGGTVIGPGNKTTGTVTIKNNT
jgi:hypothetical protein